MSTAVLGSYGPRLRLDVKIDDRLQNTTGLQPLILQ